MYLDIRAMTAPVKNPEYHNYNCHMAVLQWAALAIGRSVQEAVKDVERITRSVCPHCKGQSPLKASLQNEEYGKIFCRQGVPLVNTDAQAGDVVVIPNIGRPMHSMVIVSAVGGVLLVRGYNNAGTFVGAARDQYDDTSRNLAGRVSPQSNPVFRIPEAQYLAKVRDVVRMLALKPPQ